jgi:hypothetical protein
VKNILPSVQTVEVKAAFASAQESIALKQSELMSAVLPGLGAAALK